MFFTKTLMKLPPPIKTSNIYPKEVPVQADHLLPGAEGVHWQVCAATRAGQGVRGDQGVHGRHEGGERVPLPVLLWRIRGHQAAVAGERNAG